MKLHVFIIKLIARTGVLSVLGLFAKIIRESAVITNEIALGQMQNSNELFIKWEFYQKVQPIAYFVFVCYAIWFVYKLFRDIQKLIKTYEEKEQE